MDEYDQDHLQNQIIGALRLLNLRMGFQIWTLRFQIWAVRADNLRLRFLLYCLKAHTWIVIGCVGIKEILYGRQR